MHALHFSGSKFAAYGYTEALADELRRVYKKPGVKTTVVCPMFINTNLVHQHDGRATHNAGYGIIFCQMEHVSRIRVLVIHAPHLTFVLASRREGMHQPEDVAETILDGVLRNQTEIYIPPQMKRTDFMKA